MQFGVGKKPFVIPDKPPPGMEHVKLSAVERHEADRDDLKRICVTVGLEPNESNIEIVKRILAASNYVAATRKS